MHARVLSWLAAVVVMGAIDATAQPLAFEYADYPAGRGARAIVAADFNRDGWPDVASAAIDTAAVSVLLSAHGEGLSQAITVAVGRGPFDMAPVISSAMTYRIWRSPTRSIRPSRS